MQPTSRIATAGLLGLILGLSACPDARSQDDESGCIPGEEGCACNEGQCLAGLACLSDLCVEEPNSLTSGDPDEGDSGPKPDLGDGDTSSGCVDNLDCGPEEACVDSTCYDTDYLYFYVQVDYFLPSSSRCDDGVGDGTVELFYRAFMSEELQLVSANEDCPAQWTEGWYYDSLQPFRIEFWEEDIAADDLILNTCWQDGQGECTRIPKSILHDGVFDGVIDTNSMGYSFTPSL